MGKPQFRGWILAAIIVVTTVLALGGAWLGLARPSEFAAAQARWSKRPFSCYRLVVDQVSPITCHYDVDIHTEKVVTTFQNTCPQPLMTVSDMFNVIGSQLRKHECGPNGCDCDGPIGILAKYDAQFGYPTQWEIRTRPELRWQSLFGWKQLFSANVYCTLIGFIGQKVTVSSLTPLP